MILDPKPRFWIKTQENPGTYRLISGGLKPNRLQLAPVRVQNFEGFVQKLAKNRQEPRNCHGGRRKLVVQNGHLRNRSLLCIIALENHTHTPHALTCPHNRPSPHISMGSGRRSPFVHACPARQRIRTRKKRPFSRS